MKITLIAASFFFLAVPVHAQTHIAGGGAVPSQLNFSGGGGGGLSGGGGFGGSAGFGAVSFRMPAANRPAEHYSYVYAQGSDATFIPTRFVSFETALKLGKAALAYRPKTIVEVAAQYRAEKKQPAALSKIKND